jgi:hypothetical protein
LAGHDVRFVSRLDASSELRLGGLMPAIAPPVPVEPVDAVPADSVCWYDEPSRHPSISRCPATCNGRPTHAERQADGAQRSYCEAHTHWRSQDGGRRRLYPIVGRS